MDSSRNTLPAVFANERVLNVRQMAELWGVSVATIRRLGRSGQLPSTIQLSDRRIGWRAADAFAALAARRGDDSSSSMPVGQVK